MNSINFYYFLNFIFLKFDGAFYAPPVYQNTFIDTMIFKKVIQYFRIDILNWYETWYSLDNGDEDGEAKFLVVRRIPSVIVKNKRFFYRI